VTSGHLLGVGQVITTSILNRRSSSAFVVLSWGRKALLSYDGRLSASWIDTRLWVACQGCISAIAASNAEGVHVQSRPGFDYVELFSVLFVVASCVCVLESAFLECENAIE